MRKESIKKFVLILALSISTLYIFKNIQYVNYIDLFAYKMPMPDDIELVREWNKHNYTESLSTAVYQWNKSPTKISFKVVSKPQNDVFVHMEDYDFGNTGWHAMTYPYNIYNDSPSIQINNHYYPFKNNSAELIAHELGHIIKLKDVPNNKLLMRAAGYKGSANPEEEDIKEVNIAYP